MSDPTDRCARPLDTAGLVAYERGAVVRRTLIKKPVGTVTRFSFDKGALSAGVNWYSIR